MSTGHRASLVRAETAVWCRRSGTALCCPCRGTDGGRYPRFVLSCPWVGLGRCCQHKRCCQTPTRLRTNLKTNSSPTDSPVQRWYARANLDSCEPVILSRKAWSSHIMSVDGEIQFPKDYSIQYRSYSTLRYQPRAKRRRSRKQQYILWCAGPTEPATHIPADEPVHGRRSPGEDLGSQLWHTMERP